MYTLLRWLLNALALLLIAFYVPGFAVSGFYAALIASLVLGLLNLLIRPLLLILTLPVNIMTLGLFTFVINASLIWLVSTIVKGFDISGFMPAIVAGILMWIWALVLHWIFKQAKKS